MALTFMPPETDFLARKIRNVDEGVVEANLDAGQSKHDPALADLRS